MVERVKDLMETVLGQADGDPACSTSDLEQRLPRLFDFRGKLPVKVKLARPIWNRLVVRLSIEFGYTRI